MPEKLTFDLSGATITITIKTRAMVDKPRQEQPKPNGLVAKRKRGRPPKATPEKTTPEKKKKVNEFGMKPGWVPRHYTPEQRAELVSRFDHKSQEKECACGRPAKGRGLCNCHYSMVVKTKEAAAARGSRASSSEENDEAEESEDDPGPVDSRTGQENVVLEGIPKGASECSSNVSYQPGMVAVSCLRCQGWFWSANKTTNRICQSCRNTNSNINLRTFKDVGSR